MREVKTRQVLSVVSLAVWFAAPPALAGDSKGAIEGRVVAKPARYQANAVIYLESVKSTFTPPSQPAHVDQKGMQFEPRVLAVLKGTTVEFLNSDPAEHNIYTPDGGMQLTGLRSALTRTLNDYARAEGYLKESEDNLTGDDVREGLVAAVSIKLREPQFEGQTKARLGNPGARTAVEAVVAEGLKEFLGKNEREQKNVNGMKKIRSLGHSIENSKSSVILPNSEY